VDQPLDLGTACCLVFTELGIGRSIDFSTLQERLRLKDVHCSNRDLKALLCNWVLDGRIEDNGGILNEYSFFKNLNIRRVECLSADPVIKISVDDDPKENLDFPSGRVSE